MSLRLYLLILFIELSTSLHKTAKNEIKRSFADNNKILFVIVVVILLTFLLLILMKIAIELANRSNAQALQNKEKKYKIITEEILIKNKTLNLDNI